MAFWFTFEVFRSKETTRPGLRPTKENAGNEGIGVDGGTPGGTLAPNSDRYNAFCERLKASGFTGKQLMLIDDALRETGLQISEVGDAPGRS